jgi:hypothetical protein
MAGHKLNFKELLKADDSLTTVYETINPLELVPDGF